MNLSENGLKWLMRFYPPLFFQRIWVLSFDKGFTGVKVKVGKSLLNKNYNGSIFGGTIFAAADPFYPVLFHQIFNSGGKNRLIIWSKSSKIDFLKPAMSTLSFEIKLTENDIAEAKEALTITGKFEKLYALNIYDKNGDVCASLLNEVYIRDLNLSKTLI